MSDAADRLIADIAAAEGLLTRMMLFQSGLPGEEVIETTQRWIEVATRIVLATVELEIDIDLTPIRITPRRKKNGKWAFHDPVHQNLVSDTLYSIAIAAIDSKKGRRPAPAQIGPGLFQAEHFRLKYGLTSNRLAKARQSGRLRKSKKRGGRWYYDFDEVRRYFPDAVDF